MDNKYCKRQGTSGIRGQLYETKLLSLINFRFLHYDDIETFHLATNVDKIGSFDDICFKIELKGEKPFFVFIQAKHKENIKRLFSYKPDILKNFNSYLTIRYKFEPKQKDVLFKGNFDETQCLFVMYSNAKNELTDLDESKFTETLNELIGTGPGGNVKKPFNSAEDVKYLCGIIIKEQINRLAGRMVPHISGKGHFQNLLNDQLVLRFHVIMRQKVFDVSDIFDAHDPLKRHRMATFRQEFFDNHEEHILLFKEALYTQILKERKLTDDDKHNLEEYLKNPLDVATLSKLIVSVISYNNGQLQLVKRASSLKDFRQKIRATYVPQLIVNKAIELAAKEILETQKFKVPTSFGNKDLTLKGRKRLDFVTDKLSKLIEQSETNEITIAESQEDKEGFLKLNGGITGAVGNVLVLDKDPKYIKFTDNCDELEGWAKILFEKLNERIDNLQEYKINFKIRELPMLAFDCYSHEEDIARDFLNKLLFFTDQSDEAGVGDQLMKAIEEERKHVKHFLVNTDAIYLRYFDKIQTWWMNKDASYLTKSFKMLENVIDDILKDRLMSFVRYMTNMNEKTCLNYTFKEDAVKCIKLQLQTQNILIAENCAMLLAKVVQYLKHFEEEEMKKLTSELNNTCEKQIDDKKNLFDTKTAREKQIDETQLSPDTKNKCEKQRDNKKKTLETKLKNLDLEYIVLDFKYIMKLLPNEFEALSAELSNANDKKLLIFVCDDMQNTDNVRKSLKSIAKAIGHKKIIVITNEKSVNTIQKYFIQTSNVVSDDKHGIIDLIAKSQKSMLENAKVIFQGKEVSLDLIVDGESMKYVKGEVLNCVIQQKNIVIGKAIGNKHYDKTSYIDGRLKSNKNGEDIKTLNAIDNDVVVVTAKPGMGKSTLLTHLSLETKKIDPKIWIVRINLLEHSSIFSKWKNANTNIDTLETLKFMCHIILYEKFGKNHDVHISLEEVDGVVQLKDCNNDQWTVFELELFLHFYNRKKIIFLFDGLDEIYSYYKNEVLNCLECVRNCPQKHKIWLTSRPYNEIESILRNEFGNTHEMEPLSYNDRAIYLAKFWKSNLILNQFDSRQLDNVYDFIKYMLESENRVRQGLTFEQLLHEIYVSAGLYLVNEIKHTHVPLWKYERDNDDSYYIEEISDMYTECFDDEKSDGTPLLLHLTADYFQSLIKAKREAIKWNLDINTFDIYDKYLEKKLKIRVEEKYGADICMPDFHKDYKEKLTKLILKHKKLGAYAIFSEFRDKLFSKKELKKIMNNIKFIEKANDGETGHICKVANGTPIFAHVTFTEYYAVEYICDVLKNERCKDKQQSVLDFIFNVVLVTVDLRNVHSIFDHKLKTDQTLYNVLLQKNDYIFDILLEQGKKHSEYITSLWKKQSSTPGNISTKVSQGKQKNSRTTHNSAIHHSINQWAFTKSVSGNLHNVEELFLSILKSNLNEQNANVFYDILKIDKWWRKHF